MPLWGSTDLANNAPKFHIGGGIAAKNIAAENATNHVVLTGNNTYQNTSANVFVSGVALGVFGVDANERSNTSFEGANTTHSGWVQRIADTGYIESLAITTPGANYVNGFITFSGGTGAVVNANASFFVNANGNVVSVVLNSRGSGYLTAPTASASNGANGSPAAFTVTMGGRFGRKHYETLVAMGSMSRDANTDDAVFGG